MELKSTRSYRLKKEGNLIDKYFYLRNQKHKIEEELQLENKYILFQVCRKKIHIPKFI